MNEMDDGERPIDEFHKHEVLHTAAVAMNLFANEVQAHRYTESDPELVAQAEKTMDALMAFYTLVGTKTL